MEQLVNEYLRQLRAKDLAPTTLRHHQRAFSFLRTLGHRSMNTTIIYTHVAMTPLRAAYQAAHPRARIQKESPS